MHFVYVIQSIATQRLYFGRTDDLDKRLASHNGGEVDSTQKWRPWEYVYVEGFKSKQDAVARELQLKQYGNARTYAKRRLKYSLINK